jgi:hypothetical protein
MSTDEQSQRKGPRVSRLFWLTLVTLFVFASAGAISLWLPYHQRQATVADLAKRGGVVATSPAAPEWLRDYFAPDQLKILHNVVAVDLLKATVTDDDIELLLDFPKLQTLSVYGPELTDAGLLQLKEFSDLRNLMLVNCPQVSAEALRDLQTAKPRLEIGRRGSALLGITGETVPDGCLLITIVPGLPADLAGLRRGDVITQLDGQEVTGYPSLTDLLMPRQPGDVVRITLAPVVKPIEPHQRVSPSRTVNATLTGWR